MTQPFSASLGTRSVYLYTRSISNDVDRSRNLKSELGETGVIVDLLTIIEDCILSKLTRGKVFFLKRLEIYFTPRARSCRASRVDLSKFSPNLIRFLDSDAGDVYIQVYMSRSLVRASPPL